MPAAPALSPVTPCANVHSENVSRRLAARRIARANSTVGSTRRCTMAAASTPNPISSPASATASQPAHEEPQPKPRWPWLKYATPFMVLLLAAAVMITITRNWNAWEGGRTEQVTDDAIVRGDLTPLSTKVAGIVRNVKVSDFQRVHAGDLLVELQDDDYQAQLAQASAAVEASKAAIQNNRKQRDLQDSRIERASSGI